MGRIYVIGAYAPILFYIPGIRRWVRLSTPPLLVVPSVPRVESSVVGSVWGRVVGAVVIGWVSRWVVVASVELPVGVDVLLGFVFVSMPMSVSILGLRQPVSREAVRITLSAKIAYFFIISSLKVVYEASISRFFGANLLIITS